MKFFIFLSLAVASGSTFDPSEIFSKKLFVPTNPEEFLKAHEGIVEQSRDERIANGTDASDGQFPYAVNFFPKFKISLKFLSQVRLSLFETGGAAFVCSAVIIDRMYMLSVRHCFDPVLTYSVMGAVGSVDRSSSDMRFYFGSKFYFAPPIDGWNPDLAVIRMDSPITFDDRVNYVRLPAGHQEFYDFPQYLIQLVGWGKK